MLILAIRDTSRGKRKQKIAFVNQYKELVLKIPKHHATKDKQNRNKVIYIYTCIYEKAACLESATFDANNLTRPKQNNVSLNKQSAGKIDNTGVPYCPL